MKEALFYKNLKEDTLQCQICPHYCVIKPGQKGRCEGRKNKEGKLYALNYQQLVTIANDPIEKKPLYHFYPGESIISVGPNGCNFQCQFCQNWRISQNEAPTRSVTSQELVDMAENRGSVGIAYTYTEPLIWYEYLLESCRLAHKSDLVNVLVSNGYINPDPFEKLLPHIDAMNIDLKSMDPEFYKEYCLSTLEPVLETIKTAAGNIHLEITNLIIPTLNDDMELIKDLVNFIKDIDPDIPLHISSYRPAYKMDINPTPKDTIRRIFDYCNRELSYVYVGNTFIGEGTNTLCKNCGETLIERKYRTPNLIGLEGNKCSNCGTRVDIPGL